MESRKTERRRLSEARDLGHVKSVHLMMDYIGNKGRAEVEVDRVHLWTENGMWNPGQVSNRRAGVGRVGRTWALFCSCEIRSALETKNGKVKQAPGCVGLELR